MNKTMKKFAILVDGKYVKKFVSDDIILYADDVKEAQLFNNMCDCLLVKCRIKGITSVVELNLNIVSINIL